MMDFYPNRTIPCLSFLARWACLLAGLVGAYLSHAGPVLQTENRPVIISDLLFEHFRSRQGLPDDRIRAFHQDRQGYLWVGTMNGLARYDGYSFRKFYRQPGPNGLVGNWINAICEDSSGNLWFGTKEGLSFFDRQREQFTSFRQQPGKANSLVNNLITSLCFDRQGVLWIGTAGGLCAYDPARQTFRQYRQYPLNEYIARIIRSDGPYLWVATNAGPVRFDVRTQTGQHFPVEARPGPYGERFWSVIELNRQLYLGTGAEGLLRLRFDAKQNRYVGFESVNRFAGSTASLDRTEIYDICPTPAGGVWLGTNRGVAYIDRLGHPDARLQLVQHNPVVEQSLSHDRVYRLLLDRTQVLWCGTEMGLNKLDLGQMPFRYFTFANQQSKDQIRSITADRRGTIWLGTSKSGLYAYQPADRSSAYYRLGTDAGFQNYHRSVAIDSAQRLYVGTLNGVFRLDAARPSAVIDVLPGTTVFAMLTDSRGRVWIGTRQGLLRIGPDGSRTNVPIRAANAELVRAIFEDHRGGIWIGFENAGLFYLDPNTGQVTHLSATSAGQGLLGSTVYAIVEQPKGTIWVGTESGLNKLTLGPAHRNRGTSTPGPIMVAQYTEKDGLPDPSVNGILPDRQGHLWMSTLKGLVRFEPANASVRVYLPTLIFSHNCHYRFPDGRLVFGTADGFVLFDPARIPTDDSPPRVVIDNLKLFNREVSIGQTLNDDVLLPRTLSDLPTLQLNYRNNVFTVGFTALHFVNPARNRYGYRLVGFDRNWTLTDAGNRSATYTNLDPGTYRFEVRAANNVGHWVSAPTVLTVEMLPPPWKTWWAYTLYVLLLAGALYAVGRYLLLVARQRQQLLFEQREKEQMQKLNGLKLEFFTDISHEFRTPLTLITSPVEDLLTNPNLDRKTRATVQLIQRNCQKLLHLLDELMTFQKLEQGKLKLKPEELDLVAFAREVFDSFEPLTVKNGLDYRFTASTPSLRFTGDPDKLEKILNNLLNNAIKFTPSGGYVQLKLTVNPGLQQVVIEVEDSGKGITPDERQHLFERFFQSETNKYGVGVGLSLTKSLVELHGGQIGVESEPGRRTCFTITLPAPLAPLTTAAPPVVREVAPEPLTPALPTRPVLPLRDDRPVLLIADDHDDILDYLEGLFAHSYRIVRAANGVEALRAIGKGEPDLIISDVMMPEMDGITLCRTLKTDLNTCHIPLILLTARSAIAHQIEGIGTGADDYVPKPFHPELLRVRVQSLLESRQRLFEKFRAGGAVLPKDIARNPLDEAFLQKVMDIVTANLSNDEFSVEQLGEGVNMSRSNLFRKLKALTDQTPVEFIYYLRLKHAEQLLLERRLNISQIAFEVGFKSASAFSKAFRNQFGKAPSEYLSDKLAGQLSP
ncbi:hybrid sensor histidine kinase/response regulator transcription factor [Rudanella lutea]|uniref:hybrid sensor histidine kinase/response regulator transcription factor n=1 Tax=Rudanella lutea TaxID=451374 RepID=UPI0003A2EE62|nr:two-component regulator propeller domain-containing protein [Rudanella lutea]